MCFMTKHNYVERKSPKTPNNTTATNIICVFFNNIFSSYVKMSFCFPFKQQASNFEKFNDTHKIYTLQRHNIDVLMCFNKIYLIINLNK